MYHLVSWWYLLKGGVLGFNCLAHLCPLYFLVQTQCDQPHHVPASTPSLLWEAQRQNTLSSLTLLLVWYLITAINNIGESQLAVFMTGFNNVMEFWEAPNPPLTVNHHQMPEFQKTLRVDILKWLYNRKSFSIVHSLYSCWRCRWLKRVSGIRWGLTFWIKRALMEWKAWRITSQPLQPGQTRTRALLSLRVWGMLPKLLYYMQVI